MPKRYDRGSPCDYAMFEVGGIPRQLDLNWLGSLLAISSIVRIRPDDMPERLIPGQSYLHFGLPVHDHFEGEKVLVASIIEHGHFVPGEEKLPLLSFAGAMIAKITLLKPELDYEQADPLWFSRRTVGNIQSVTDLRINLASRYRRVLRLSDEEIEKKGFSLRKLKIVRHLTSAEKTRLEC